MLNENSAFKPKNTLIFGSSRPGRPFPRMLKCDNLTLLQWKLNHTFFSIFEFKVSKTVGYGKVLFMIMRKCSLKEIYIVISCNNWDQNRASANKYNIVAINWWNKVYQAIFSTSSWKRYLILIWNSMVCEFQKRLTFLSSLLVITIYAFSVTEI